MISNKRLEPRVCKDCGADFEARIWLDKAGKDLSDPQLCQPCLNKQLEKEHAERMAKQLEEVKRDMESLWLFEESHIPTKYINCTFSTFDAKKQPEAFNAVKNLQWEYDDENPPKSLLLASPDIYGLGKTHLVCALLQEIIVTSTKASIIHGSILRRRCPVYYTTENALLRRIRNTYDERSEETEERVYRHLCNIPLLVIDDVGKVRPRDYSFLQGAYFNIIDERYSNSLPVLLTTNLSYQQLEEHIGGACADRLREMCGKGGFIKMAGTSYRKGKSG